MTNLWNATKHLYVRFTSWLAAYVANDDPYAVISNTGAFIVWSNQPFYPLYVAWIAGQGAWPSLITWISAPAFIGAPLLARRHSRAGRSLFVVAGLGNSMLSLKLFGPDSGVGWFLVPCLVLAAGYFRTSEWPTALPLVALTALCALAIPHIGAPFHAYSDPENRSLTHLNLYSVTALTLYLVVAMVRVRWAESKR